MLWIISFRPLCPTRWTVRSVSIQSVLYIKQQRASFCVFEQAEIANTALQDIQLTAAKAKSISVRTAETIATMCSATVFNRLWQMCRASRSMGHFRAHSAKDSTSTAKTGWWSKRSIVWWSKGLLREELRVSGLYCSCGQLKIQHSWVGVGSSLRSRTTSTGRSWWKSEWCSFETG